MQFLNACRVRESRVETILDAAELLATVGLDTHNLHNLQRLKNLDKEFIINYYVHFNSPVYAVSLMITMS